LFASGFASAPPPAGAVQAAGINAQGVPEQLAKVDVTGANLARWFQDSIITSPIRIDSIERASPVDLIRLFDYPGDFVPVIVGQGKESTEQSRSHVIDKPALSLQLARAYVTDLLEEARL
jgi:hypothetical protein